MPLDRFAYLKPIDRFGQVTLKPVELNKYKGISLNADAASGVVRVEILDENGYRIKGFSKEDCNPITGDSIRHNVSWGEKSISELPNGKYLIRIFSNNAALYAITFFIK
jgi:flagellar hook assembly protein FlgD